MITGALGHLRQLILHGLSLFLRNDTERTSMAGTLEDKVAAIDNLTGIDLLLGVLTLSAGRDTCSQFTLTVSFGQRRQIVHSILPGHIAGRHIATSAKAEQDGAAVGEEEFIVILGIEHVDLIWETQVEELMYGI